MTRREPPVDPPEPRCRECGQRIEGTVVFDEYDRTWCVGCWSPS